MYSPRETQTQEKENPIVIAATFGVAFPRQKDAILSYIDHLAVCVFVWEPSRNLMAIFMVSLLERA